MFNSYEELRAAVERNKNSHLILEIGLGNSYSAKHEEAKKELEQAKALKTLTGGQGFISDNITELEQKVEETRVKSESVFVKFRKVPVMRWASLVKQQNVPVMEQYEKVLPDTFVGLYADSECTHLLTENHKVLSGQSEECIIDGGVLISVIRAFMDWQNDGGQVVISPLTSGQV